MREAEDGGNVEHFEVVVGDSAEVAGVVGS